MQYSTQNNLYNSKPMLQGKVPEAVRVIDSPDDGPAGPKHVEKIVKGKL